MKPILTTLLIASTSLLIGCNKPNNKVLVETNNTPDIEQRNRISDVNKTIERVYEFDMELDSNDLPAGIQEMIERYVGQDGEVEIQVIVNGEVMGGMNDMPMHFMNTMGIDNPDTRNKIHEFMMRSEGRFPEEMHERMMRGEGGPPEELHQHMRRDYDGGDWDREFRHDVSEEEEFMQKVNMFYEVAIHLQENEAIALLGIHMIRDQLEPEMRLEILGEIIESTDDGSSSRNAAILVTIETLRELDQQDEAAEYMAELVISNTMDWDGDYDDEDDYDD